MPGRVQEMLISCRHIVFYSTIFTKRKLNGKMCTTQIHQARLSQVVTPSAMLLTIFRINNGDKQKDKGNQETELEEIYKLADRLYKEYDIQRLYDLLVIYKDSEDPELLWRLARATSSLARMHSDHSTRKTLTYQAYDYAKRGLAINEKNHGCHQWCGMLMVFTGEYEALKNRIKNAFHIKGHFINAMKIKPDDATTLHSLGSLCYYFADMPWYQRQIASALFAAPPVSTYEEALHYLLQAEKASPNFDTNNLTMLGKTYLNLKDMENGIMYLKKARDRTPITEYDKQAQKEALDLLKKLGTETLDE